MRSTPARFVLAIAATLVLVLSCYGLARAYLAYEADRAGRMLKELAAVKIGDSEGQVLPMLERYGNCRGVLQPYKKVDKTDYECWSKLALRASTTSWIAPTLACFIALPEQF
jgi:hypothetical protein